MKKKILLLLLFSVIMIGQGSALTIDGLNFEEVEPSFSQSGITFQVYEQNMTLSPKEVFVPDEISDKATLSGYNYQSVAQGDRVEFTGYTYQQYVDYGSEDLNDLLGRGGADATGNNYPANYFQIGAYSSNLTGQNESVADVFDYEFKEENSGYDVFWKINVSSHYEHLIIDYDLYYNDTTDGSSAELVHSFQDVYSGQDTEKVAFSNVSRQTYFSGEFDQEVVEIDALFDNSFEPSHEITVGVAVPKGSEVLNRGFSGKEVSRNWSGFRSDLVDNGINQSFLIDDQSGYNIRYYNLTVQEDSIKDLSTIFTPSDSQNNAYIYVLGSVGSVSGSASTNNGFPATLEWSKAFDADRSGQATATGVDVNSQGEVYVGFYEWDGSRDVGFVQKFWSNGTAQFQADISGTFDNLNDLIVDSNGDVVVVGETPGGSALIAKYTDTGSDLSQVWSKTPRSGRFQGVGVDSNNNYVAVGEDSSNGLIYSWTESGTPDITYSRSGYTEYHEVVFDSSNNIYATGQENNADCPCTVTTKLNPGGSHLWTESTSPTSTNYRGGIGIDENGDLIVGSDDGGSNFLMKRYSQSGSLQDSGSYPASPYYLNSVTVRNDGSNRYIFGGVITDSDRDPFVFGTDSNFGDSWSWRLTGGKYNTAKEVHYEDGYLYITGRDDGSDPRGFVFKYGYNKAPRVSKAEYVESEKTGNRDLNISIDDEGEADIASYSGVSNVGTFNNQTLFVNSLTVPYSASLNITDSKSAVGSYSFNFDKSVSGVLEKASYDHTLSNQRVKKEVNFTNEASDQLWFRYVFSDVSGTTTVNDTAIGSVAGNSFSVGEGVWENDWISNEHTTDGYSENNSRSQDLGTQYLLNGTTFHAESSGSVTFNDINASSHCSELTAIDVAPGSNSFSCGATEISGDFISNEKAYPSKHSSGEVIYGSGIDQNFTSTLPIYLEMQYNASLSSVNMSSLITEPAGCSTNSVMASVNGLQNGNSSITQECDPGKEKGYTPVLKSESSLYYTYTYEATTVVNSNASDEVDHHYCFPKSRLDNWENRDPSETSAKVDGSSKDVSVEERAIGGTDNVCIVTGDQHTQSSKHAGEHTETLIYKESKDTGGSSGSSGGAVSTGGTETIIKEVDGDQFAWTLSSLGAVSSGNDGEVYYQFFGNPGRSGSTPLKLTNNGNGNVTLQLECISSDGSCDWVDLSVDEVTLDSESFNEKIVNVEWSIPENVTRDNYRFKIRVTDPSYPQNDQGMAEAVFDINMNSPVAVIIQRFSRLFEWVEISPDALGLGDIVPDDAKNLPIPFILIPLIPSGVIFAVMRAISSGKGSILAIQIVATFLIFLMITGIIPPL